MRLAGAATAGFVMVIIRMLTKFDQPVTIMSYQAIGVGLLMAAPAIWFWTTPTLVEVGLLVAIGAISVVTQMCNIYAFRAGEASAIAPFDYMRLLFAIVLGLAALPLVFAYPFMKRITYWPQAWLGLTFNWGALMGWAAVTGALAWPPVLLYLAGLAWTLGYDTIYAHQDKEDDALIGVKSTALKFGRRTKPWLAGFYGATLALMLAAGLTAGLGWPYLLGLLGVAGHFAWQVATLDIDDPANCLTRFRANRFVGWILLAGIVGAGAPTL